MAIGSLTNLRSLRIYLIRIGLEDDCGEILGSSLAKLK